MKTFWVLAILFSLVAGYITVIGNRALKPEFEIVLAGKVFLVDIAHTQQKQAKGLSGIKRFADNEGLLFIFDHDDTLGIWMKDMLLPIDILWFNREGVLVDYVENISPDTFPEVYSPKENARYVLELNAGIREKYNIELGELFTLPE
ncbi:MAG: DUF192 domain-containing protein [bacterium]|nr:DUF192 domain-containing protein [bacterium]